MSRNIPTEIRNEQGIRRYKTELLVLPPAADDIIIQITSPDRLDKLAQEFYGNPELWWVIASLNSIKGTYVVPSDTIIRIPNRNRISSYIEQLNATR
jgi:hypothetical protein